MNHIPEDTTSPRPSLNHLLHERSIQQVIADTQARIRAEPTAVAHRWLLCQLLCLTGEWERARKQLPVVARGDAGMEPLLQLTGALIGAEEARAEVFAGCSAPAVMGTPPVWLLGLVEALAREGAGDQTAADACRETALAEAGSPSGRSDLGTFAWLADGDSRLGPVCEVILNGRYHWLPLCQIAAFFVATPSNISDLIWSPVSLVLRDGQTYQGFLPARYPGSENDDDALRLGWKTVWWERGRTGVFGLGQKMWMSDAGEWALLDLRECLFDEVPTGETQGGGDAQTR